MKGFSEKKPDVTLARVEAVVIGTSAGGLRALTACLSSLPRSFSLPVLIVQHVHSLSTGYADLLAHACHLPVIEAGDQEKILPGTIYLAPANYHLMVENEETLALSVQARVSYSRPSIDVLFESASDVYRDRLVGVILTGAGRDGADGLKYIKDGGGIAIVQEPKDAEFDAMPTAAIGATEVDYILGLQEIGQFLVSLGEIASRKTGDPRP